MDELVGEIRDGREVMIDHHPLPRGVMPQEGIDVLREVEHDDDHHEQGHGKEKGAEKLF